MRSGRSTLLTVPVLALALAWPMTPAAAATVPGSARDFSDCSLTRETSGPRTGYAVSCHGTSFKGFVECARPDGSTYRHEGRTVKGWETSVALCDAGDGVVAAGAAQGT